MHFYDVMLLTQWLKSLDPFVCDFLKLQMVFSIHGNRFALKGAKSLVIKLFNKSFSQTIQHRAEILFLYMDKFNNNLDAPTCNVHKVKAMILKVLWQMILESLKCRMETSPFEDLVATVIEVFVGLHVININISLEG